MKTVTTKRSWRMVAAIPAALLLLLLAGCLEKTLVWSPDGTRAAVISNEHSISATPTTTSPRGWFPMFIRPRG